LLPPVLPRCHRTANSSAATCTWDGPLCAVPHTANWVTDFGVLLLCATSYARCTYCLMVPVVVALHKDVKPAAQNTTCAAQYCTCSCCLLPQVHCCCCWRVCWLCFCGETSKAGAQPACCTAAQNTEDRMHPAGSPARCPIVTEAAMAYCGDTVVPSQLLASTASCRNPTHHMVPPMSLLRAYSQVGGFLSVKPPYVT
jgi:hypothetical protein